MLLHSCRREATILTYDAVAHAKSYPFPVLGRSYLFRDGVSDPLDDFDRSERTPVLAAGSNQSFEQIARKYANVSAVIPVQKAVLHDFDTVYAAHFAHYGSIPATYYASPGTVVAAHVLWLDDAQLARMHETERSYSFDRLDGIRIEIPETGEVLRTAWSYSAAVGCVNAGGAPASLAEIAAEGRILPAMSQTEMLSHARDLLAPGGDLDAFIREHMEDADLRRARTASFSADSIPLNFERTTILPNT